MLVLTRRPGERICIGDGIVVTVIAAGRGKVRLGVDAPKDISIVRDEVPSSFHGTRRRIAQSPANELHGAR